MSITTIMLVAARFSLFVAYVSLCVSHVDGAHIYGIPNMNFYSHSKVLITLGQELVKRGHKYTHVLPDIAKWKDIPDDINTAVYKTSVSAEEVKNVMAKLAQAGDDLRLVYNSLFESRSIASSMAEDLIAEKRLIQEMNSSASLLLCDLSNFLCPVLADVLHKIRVDIIPIINIEPFAYFYYGQPQTLVIMPKTPSLTYLDVSFLARLKNTLTMPLWHLLMRKVFSMEHIWNRFDGEKSSSYQMAIQSASMVLIPNDFVIEFPRALPAHMKMIGPVLPEPAKELPLDFKSLLHSPADVMVTSLGTVSNYDSSLNQILADGFSRLPLKVLWKQSDKIPPRVGNNTKIFSFIPQNDLLGNTNVKLFFMHGGGNSLFESIYHSVPMVVMPLNGDQYRSAAIVKEKRIGVVLRKEGLTSDQVFTAVTRVLEDPQYANNIKKMSNILKDRKRTPREEGADWIECVLRHEGANHLKNPLIGLSFYQEYMLDVFIFLGFCMGIFLYITFKLFTFICRKLVCSRSAETKHKTN